VSPAKIQSVFQINTGMARGPRSGTRINGFESYCTRDLITKNIPFIYFGSEVQVWGSNRRLGNVPDLINVEDLYRVFAGAVPREQVFVRQ
jgi:hypothetical protein